MTNLVWQKLEQQNRSFFRTYELHLQLKDQTEHFNDSVGRPMGVFQNLQMDQQVKLQKERQTGSSELENLMKPPLLSPIKTDLDTGAFFAPMST